MKNKDKKSSAVSQIITAAIIALLVGGTSPWWWKEFFNQNREIESPIEENVVQNDAATFTPSTVMIPSKDVFDPGSTNIKSVPRDMSRVIKTLISRPEWNVEISVHTDNSGDFNTNISISSARAKNLKEYFFTARYWNRKSQG